MSSPVSTTVMDRAGAGGVLGGFGLLLIGVSILSGGLSPGFSLEVPMFLLRVGIAFSALGAATASLRSISVNDAIVVSVVALVVVFVVGAAVMYYDFMTTTPEIESPLTMTMLAAHQAAITIVLAPVPAGFVAGVLEKRGRPRTAYRTLFGTTAAAWIAASLVILAGGPVSAITEGLVLIFTIAAAGIALFPRQLLRQAAEVDPK